MKKIIFSLSLFVSLIAFTSPVFAAKYALDFGTTKEYKFIEIGPDERFDTEEITFQAWIRPTALPTGHYIYEGRSTIAWNGDYASGHDPYIFYINEYGSLEAYSDFESGQSAFIIDDNPVSLNSWHHVALTIDPFKMKLFLDGNEVEELVHNSGPVVQNHSWLSIGRHLWYQNPFAGYIDDVSIWDKALSKSEIIKTMKKINGKEKSLVAYWDFNEGKGQIVHDSSANEIDGTLGFNTNIEIYDPNWIRNKQIEAVPEPFSMFLFCLGSAIMVLNKKIRKSLN
jgi:hypothetical protein